MKHLCKRLSALLMAFALLSVTIPASAPAAAVELDRRCSISFSISGKNEYPDLSELELVADIYKLANATNNGTDYSYGLETIAPYSELQEYLDGEMNGDVSEIMTQAAAKIALDNEPDVTGAPLTATVTGDAMTPGLYLVLVHGADITNKEDYVEYIPNLSTVAKTPGRTFRFSPVLVSMPGIGGLPEDDGWVYNVKVTLKCEPETRYGTLSIMKNLAIGGNAEIRPATFVFQIEAVLDGKNVYSDVVAMTISASDREGKSLNDIKLPVGAEVTVKEIYSGVGYDLVSDDVQTIVIGDDESLHQVSFTNAPNDSALGGGSVTNSFEYHMNGNYWSHHAS